MSKITNRANFFNNTLLNYLCASILLCSFITVKASAATLTITDNLIVRDMDDKAVEQGFLSKKKTLELTQGKHSLVIKYKDVFEDLALGGDILVDTDYFVVKFSVENQQELFLTTTNISNLASAERFVKSPELTMLDEHKQEVVLDLETLSEYKLGKQVAKVVTTLSAPASMAQINSNTSSSTEDDQAFNNQVINKVDTVPMLKYWWNKANKDEKEKFFIFINKNKELK
ncbi:MAG: DUF2057 family protein [Colwellia sp.]